MLVGIAVQNVGPVWSVEVGHAGVGRSKHRSESGVILGVVLAISRTEIAATPMAQKPVVRPTRCKGLPFGESRVVATAFNSLAL